MSLELPGAKLLPSATYSGKGEYNPGGAYDSANLYYPSSGEVVINPNLEVTGTEVVDGDKTIGGDLGVVGRAFFQTAVYGTGTSVPCAFPAGMVGGTTTPDARAILPVPRGLRISADGANFVDVTTSASAGGEHQVNIANGLVTGGTCFVGQNGGFVQIGTATAQGAVILTQGPGQGTFSNPIVVPGPFTPPTAGIQTIQLAGNKAWFLIPASTGFGNGTILVVKPPNGDYIGRILPYMDPPLGTAGLSLTLGGGYGAGSDFTFINSLFGGSGGSTWLVGVEFL